MSIGYLLFKVRRTLIAGSKRMILYDDIEASEKIRMYDKGIDVKNRPESLYKALFPTGRETCMPRRSLFPRRFA